MAYRVHEIRSISDLIKRLKTDLPAGDPAWFRGHGDSSWKLRPGYQRLKDPPPESVLVKRFKQNANLLVSNVGDNSFDWLFYLQHYGVPTRLLDWSESPLYGLYFAVMTHPKKDGAVWALKPILLNQITTSNSVESKFLPSFEDDLLRNYSTESVEAWQFKSAPGVLPMAAIATRNNPRIQAQLGVFTISHKTTMPIEEIDTGNHVVKYTIPKDAKPDLQAELRLLGINKFQLFPELSSAGEMIKESLK